MPINQAHLNSASAAAAAAAGSSISGAIFSNRSFLDDDSNPPSYHSIYPSGLTSTDEKDPKPTSSSSANDPSSSHTAAASSLVANLFQNMSHDSCASTQQEPIISYDQLYYPPLQQPTSLLSTPNALVIQHRPPPLHHSASATSNRYAAGSYSSSSSSSTNRQSINTRVRKQFHQIFTKAYLLKHFIFISVSSMMIILFQIILINNQSVLSHLAAGLWCGLANLFTLLITIITLRYAKVWLLIISIILHFMCLTVSLGSFVVINSVAASRYGACTSFYNPFYDHVIYEQQAGNGLVDKSGSSAAVNNCLSTNFKYANIAMILLGATCMVMFVSFFIKLVAAFNNVHSSRE